jgi:hypothetical protein
MSDSRTLSGLRRPLLFLKATVKKQVFIPTYTRGDGTVVPGHNAMVHVAVDHDDAKVAAGQGTHSQRQAHARLARDAGFHALPTQHKAAVVMKHATEIQDAASAAAQLSTFRKKVLAGEKPSAAELKRFEAAPDDKRRALVSEFRAAGKLDAVPQAHHDLPEPDKERSAPAKKAAQPVADAGSADTSKDGADAHLEAINAAKLPASNVNAKVVNMKLDAIAAALKSGDAALLTMMSYGSNNYAKKQVNLANRALELLGSAERVKPGQKGTPGFRTDAQIAAAKQAAKAQRTVDPESDSLMTAIAKLGGLKASEVSSQWGLSKNDVKGVRVGILPVFSSRGKSIERMAEALHELGYLNSEEHNELADHVEKGLGGGDHFTAQGYANKAAKDHEAHYQGLTGQDVAASGFDDLPPEAQQQIEEFLDENPDFTAEEIENFERMQQLADADDVPFEPLDFGTKGARHYDFGQADEGSGKPDDVPF